MLCSADAGFSCVRLTRKAHYDKMRWVEYYSSKRPRIRKYCTRKRVPCIYGRDQRVVAARKCYAAIERGASRYQVRETENTPWYRTPLASCSSVSSDPTPPWLSLHRCPPRPPSPRTYCTCSTRPLSTRALPSPPYKSSRTRPGR